MTACTASTGVLIITDRVHARGVRMAHHRILGLLRDGAMVLPGWIITRLLTDAGKYVSALLLVPPDWSMSHGELAAASTQSQESPVKKRLTIYLAATPCFPALGFEDAGGALRIGQPGGDCSRALKPNEVARVVEH